MNLEHFYGLFWKDARQLRGEQIAQAHGVERVTFRPVHFGGGWMYYGSSRLVNGPFNSPCTLGDFIDEANAQTWALHTGDNYQGLNTSRDGDPESRLLLLVGDNRLLAAPHLPIPSEFQKRGYQNVDVGPAGALFRVGLLHPRNDLSGIDKAVAAYNAPEVVAAWKQLTPHYPDGYWN